MQLYYLYQTPLSMIVQFLYQISFPAMHRSYRLLAWTWSANVFWFSVSYPCNIIFIWESFKQSFTIHHTFCRIWRTHSEIQGKFLVPWYQCDTYCSYHIQAHQRMVWQTWLGSWSGLVWRRGSGDNPQWLAKNLGSRLPGPRYSPRIWI